MFCMDGNNENDQKAGIVQDLQDCFRTADKGNDYPQLFFVRLKVYARTSALFETVPAE